MQCKRSLTTLHRTSRIINKYFRLIHSPAVSLLRPWDEIIMQNTVNDSNLSLASRQCLARFRKFKPPEDLYSAPISSRAAVLIILFAKRGDGELHVVLTTRATTLRTHAGDVALPGGKTECRYCKKKKSLLFSYYIFFFF